MRIVFIRHGEPDYEHDCLTPAGRKQALAAALRLENEGIGEIWSSTMGRTLETAAPTAERLGLPVKPAAFMREVDWGSRDGSPLFSQGHPWNIADEMARRGENLLDPAWRENSFFRNNTVTDSVTRVETGIDPWLADLGYIREGLYYRCVREDSEQKTVAFFCHGGSSCAALAHILNLTFPYACALLHLEFTGITVLRFDRHPGSLALPCMELANDGRHIGGACYFRLNRM